MKINFYPVEITSLYKTTDDQIYAILKNSYGEIISHAPIATVLNIIDTKCLALMNDKEVLDLLDILYGIDYSKYGKLNAGYIRSGK